MNRQYHQEVLGFITGKFVIELLREVQKDTIPPHFNPPTQLPEVEILLGFPGTMISEFFEKLFPTGPSTIGVPDSLDQEFTVETNASCELNSVSDSDKALVRLTITLSKFSLLSRGAR